MVTTQYWHCPSCGRVFETSYLNISEVPDVIECPACLEPSMNKISEDNYLMTRYNSFFSLFHSPSKEMRYYSDKYADAMRKGFEDGQRKENQ